MMKQRKKTIITMALTGVMVSSIAIGSKIGMNAGSANYWSNVNGNWQYYQNGQKATGWIKDNGDWYYLDTNGNMKTGWFKDTDGKWYYLNSNGSMAHDTTVDGCYLNSSGVWIEDGQAEKLSSPVYTGINLMETFENNDFQYIEENNGRYNYRFYPNANATDEGAWKDTAIDIKIHNPSSPVFLTVPDYVGYDILITKMNNDSLTNSKFKEAINIADSENADTVYNKANEVYNMPSGTDITVRIGKRDYEFFKFEERLYIYLSPIIYK